MEEKILNVLLVEDDEVDIMNVKRAFKKHNIKNPLYVACDGCEALEMLRGKNSKYPNIPQQRRIILLDLNMPKMGGLEFLQEIRADSNLKSIPVIILTTSDEDKDRIKAYNLNVAGYLLKPVKFSMFAETMATLNKYWSLCEIP
ncbi:CheY-like receiver domain-containing protein [Rivularia sp. PCC 7116]|uniref:response regulator n=1 Tax=Rivularia sp. PCC 7116 TaxID=373994 RepID=UPI00029F4863|nr:response regulator [Rivularia sp. PCC 7116]AFY55246.1 CheY-like receiver domain-containing protein [Rivularia sp. PCC 7116]